MAKENFLEKFRQMRINHLRSQFNNLDELEQEDNVQKGEKENPFQKYEDAEDLEKSDIMYAISGGENPIKFSKTGKEIKEQIDTVVMPELTANLATCKSEADTLLEKCGKAPTRKPDNYWCGGIDFDCGYKIYNWDETYFETNDGRIYPTLSAEDAENKLGNKPKSNEEAQARREYNEKVRCICNIMTDMKACEILEKLGENKTYDLTARQIFALKF